MGDMCLYQPIKNCTQLYQWAWERSIPHNHGKYESTSALFGEEEGGYYINTSFFSFFFVFFLRPKKKEVWTKM